MKAFLFDLDGVLIDSERLYTEFWDRVEAMYPTGIPNFSQYIKGTNVASILDHFSNEAKPYILQHIHQLEQTIVYEPFPGAINFLKSIRAKGMRTALVTSSDNNKMEQFHRLLPEFDGLFDFIVTGSMVSKSKPDPEGYLMAAKAVGIAPQECIVVEDSLQGIRAGKAAGAEVWGIYTTLPRHRIEGEADRVFPNINALNSLTI